jgi:hypothetical protein
MKKNQKTLFVIVIILIGFASCRFSYSEPEESSGNDKSSDLIIAKKALRFIKNDNVDSLKSLLNPKILKRVKKEQIDWLMKEGQAVLNKYEYPLDTAIIVNKTTNISMSGKRVIKNFSFPFKNKTQNDKEKYFHITIVNGEIYKLFLNDHPPGMRIIEPKWTEPHLENLDLQSDNISWFRIWYDDGFKKDRKYGLHNGYYAVSGKKSKLEKIGVKRQFQEIFDLINKAEFDSTDFKYLRDQEKGDPEWIYLRMRFNNEKYEDLGEFSISCFLDEKGEKKEIMSDYIVFKHTKKTRYLLKKEKNKELVEKLRDLAHYDYDGYYEKVP